VPCAAAAKAPPKMIPVETTNALDNMMRQQKHNEPESYVAKKNKRLGQTKAYVRAFENKTKQETEAQHVCLLGVGIGCDAIVHAFASEMDASMHARATPE
jgi:hypothetical protein